MVRKDADRPPYRSIDDLPELATPEEVAEVFRCSSRYIKNECTAGKITAGKIAGKYLIPREEARAYLDRATVKASPQPPPSSRWTPAVSSAPATTAKERALAEIRARREERRKRKTKPP